ncbi:cytochrome c oxidase assembly protein [Shewanella sp. NFH-SH190041]|uniref:cytochrome c oxidase assembly protein n=1 Tax=Shewanella sp. NFH-SH190041 TaxID=2950245 RepID=UPI0021C3A94A|nr:cytochrome c oxidase assembly protein [Shewanella sp. NFH-SH190041]BDM62874.1 cytochrome c oxidase assembly protein [Shewanella sp. NFH-SH190041]
MTQEKGRSHSRLIALLLLGAAGMFGFGFALVPLYDVLCQALGINGKTNDTPQQYQAMVVDENRLVTVEFIAQIPGSMPWEFGPKVKRMQVNPGQLIRTAFIATNLSDTPLTGQAVPSVSPGQGAAYFNKTECFCFNRQQLDARASAELPLIFYVDPDLPADINTLTLSYTLFDITARESGGGNAGQGVAK